VYRALLVDFYGTLVAEDDALVARISEQISAASSLAVAPREVSHRWNRHFTALCSASHGAQFRTQREIESASLAAVARECGACIDVESFTAEMFAFWAAPTPLDGAAEFLRACRLPVCVVSNIDAADVHAAIAGLGWEFDHVVTSESCRAYKPRPEMFDSALALLGCEPSEALHVGDSVGSDLSGAGRLGIDVAWVNAAGRALPDAHEHPPRHVIRGIAEVAPLLTSPRSTRR
jgi:2-haloacid dehalogenase/putative hydrolase of the HAD superfamily